MLFSQCLNKITFRRNAVKCTSKHFRWLTLTRFNPSASNAQIEVGCLFAFLHRLPGSVPQWLQGEALPTMYSCCSCTTKETESNISFFLSYYCNNFILSRCIDARFPFYSGLRPCHLLPSIDSSCSRRHRPLHHGNWEAGTEAYRDVQCVRVRRMW